MEKVTYHSQPLFQYPTLPTCAHHFVTDTHTGSIVCTNCGLVEETNVISQKYSVSRNFPNTGGKSSSNYSKCFVKPQLKRALKMNKNLSWKVRRILIGEREIKRLVGLYEMGEHISLRSNHLFKKAIKHPAFRTHYINLIAIISVYYTCKENSFPVQLEQLLDNTKFSPRLALKYYSKIIQFLGLPHPKISPQSLISLICSKLELDQEIIQGTHQIMKLYLDNHHNGGYCLQGITAGAIYITCLMKRIPRSQIEIAESAGISEITLRARYREIQKICVKVGFRF